MSTLNADVVMLTQAIKTGVTYDLSELVSSIDVSTNISLQPGTLKATFIKDSKWVPEEGDIVRFDYKGTKVFYGKIFKRSKTTNGHWTITVYDQLRYFQSTDTINLPAMTSAGLFAQICNLLELRYRIVNDSGWACPEIVYDQKGYYSMIDDALGKTIINTGRWYIIRDNYGTLEHVALENLMTNLVIGDESMLTEYEYESSIDESYNIIKLTKDNEETSKREVYVVYDSAKIAWWGKLQFHQKIDENYNEAQAQEFAHNIMKSLSEKQKTLKLTAIGHPAISAGMGVYVKINDLSSEGYGSLIPMFITKCDHSFNPFHTMTLTMKVV